MSQERLALGEPSALETGLLPRTISPMLPATVAEPFDSPRGVFELLWDGVRAVAFIEGGSIRVHDRYLQDIGRYYPEFASIPDRVRGKNVVLDGVIVALDDEGRPDFQRLSQRLGLEERSTLERLAREVPLTYQVFDILYWQGRSVMSLPLWHRKELLRKTVRPDAFVRTPDYVEQQGLAFFEAAREHGVAGIIAKERSGTYSPGERSPAWFKLKLITQGDFVIGGYTFGGRLPAGRMGKQRNPFASLLLGQYDTDGRLIYVGEVAGGFDSRSAQQVQSTLDSLQASACPFVELPNKPRLIFWCRPEAVCRVRYGERTREGEIRFPIFVVQRPDVPASHCRLESFPSL